MTAMMHAAVASVFGKPLSIDERPIPEPGEGQVLVRIAASGVRHTGVHAADGDWPGKPEWPFVPGHEGAGTVAAVGQGVTTPRGRDRVGSPRSHSACGVCAFCPTGWETLRPKQQNTDRPVDGASADDALAPAAFAARIPDRLAFIDAAPNFDVVRKRLTIRGSIAGTRKEQEGSLDFAACGCAKGSLEIQPLETIDDVFA